MRAKTKTISAISRVARERGFTFIELILVVIIIGVLTGVALPRLNRSFNSLRLNNFASCLQDQISYWHERAIVERKPIILKINPADNEYWVEFFDTQERLYSYQVSAGVKMQAEPAQAVFYPDGSIGQITIEVISSNEERISLTTQGVFGGVKVIPAE